MPTGNFVRVVNVDFMTSTSPKSASTVYLSFSLASPLSLLFMRKQARCAYFSKHFNAPDAYTSDDDHPRPPPRVGAASTSPVWRFRRFSCFLKKQTHTHAHACTRKRTYSELMGETPPLPGGRQPAELVREATMELKLAERARLLALAEEAERLADEEAAKVKEIEVELQERLRLAAATQQALAEV